MSEPPSQTYCQGLLSEFQLLQEAGLSKGESWVGRLYSEVAKPSLSPGMLQPAVTNCLSL
jgi:hypothetical protein